MNLFDGTLYEKYLLMMHNRSNPRRTTTDLRTGNHPHERRSVTARQHQNADCCTQASGLRYQAPCGPLRTLRSARFYRPISWTIHRRRITRISPHAQVPAVSASSASSRAEGQPPCSAREESACARGEVGYRDAHPSCLVIETFPWLEVIGRHREQLLGE